MKTVRTLVLVAGLGLPVLALGVSLSGCDKASDAPAPASGTSNPKGHGHTHADGAGHDHDHDHAKGDGHDHGHSHGPATALGEQSAGGFTVKASREGDVPPGGEATFDVSITGGTAAPAAVRLWVGAQDAKGSTKAKADAEKDGWHGHVEVPKPLPADSKLWVEIESAGGEKTVVGFDLKL